jgi:hypothetical protein
MIEKPIYGCWLSNLSAASDAHLTKIVGAKPFAIPFFWEWSDL